MNAPEQRNRTAITENLKCDALIVGGGITGSLIAERLTRQGLDVVIIERELPGRGSTAASTSMLLWEIDRSLTQLTEAYGFERASRAYQASLQAVSGLKSLVAELGLPCDMRDKDSLYLAAGASAKELIEEHALRRRANLPGAFLDHAMLLETFRHCARGRDRIARRRRRRSDATGAWPAQCRRFAWRASCSKPKRVEFDSASRSVGVQLQDGHQIEARHVVLATGYVMPKIIHSTIQTVSSSWAIATAPQPENIWNGGALIWEDSKDYLYARTTASGRIIIGGEDSDEIVEPEARDALIPEKSRILDGKTRRAVAACEPRHRVSLGRNVRHHQRRFAVDRSGAGKEGNFCGLWLWRQRNHVQFFGGAIDRRADRGRNLAAAR